MPATRNASALQALALSLALLSIGSLALGTPGPKRASSDLLAARDFDEIPLERLLAQKVVTATQNEQSLPDAPASLTVVTREEIEAYGYETLAEALAGIAGLYVTNDRNYEMLSVRGFAPAGDCNTRFLLLVDGHPINEAIWSYAGIGTDSPVDLDIVERIEVERGPGSSLYGTNAILAVVQVITRAPGDASSFRTEARAGSFERTEGRLSASGPIDEDAWGIASISGGRSDGGSLLIPELASENGSGRTSGTDYGRFHRFYGSVHAGELRLTAIQTYRHDGIPTGAWETLYDDPATYSADRRQLLEATYRPAAARGEGLDLELRGYVDRAVYSATWAWAENDPQQSGEEGPLRNLSKEKETGDWYGAAGRFSFGPSPSHRITGGGEARTQKIRIHTWTERPEQQQREEEMNLEKRSGFHSLYVQEEYRPRTWLATTVGIHYDSYPDLGGTSAPRAAIVVRPSPGTTMKALYGVGFRAPSLAEREYDDGYSLVSNPDLTFERNSTFELVLEQIWKERVWTRLCVSDSRVRDLLVLAPYEGGTVRYENEGKVHLKGIEGEARIDFGALDARVSAAWVEAWDDLTGGRMVNSPRWIASAGMMGQAWGKRLLGGIDVRLLGERPTRFDGVSVPAYATADANLVWKTPVRGLAISTKLRNLTDASYSDPAGEEHRMPAIPQEGRTWSLRVSYGIGH